MGGGGGTCEPKKKTANRPSADHTLPQRQQGVQRCIQIVYLHVEKDGAVWNNLAVFVIEVKAAEPWPHARYWADGMGQHIASLGAHCKATRGQNEKQGQKKDAVHHATDKDGDKLSKSTLHTTSNTPERGEIRHVNVEVVLHTEPRAKVVLGVHRLRLERPRLVKGRAENGKL